MNHIKWNPDDLTIYSSDTSGQVLEWCLEEADTARKYSQFNNMIDTFDVTFEASDFMDSYLVVNTRDNEVIITKIKKQAPKENKLMIEQKSEKNYYFEDRVVKLDRYLKSITLTHSNKYLFLGFSPREKKFDEDRRQSTLMMEEDRTRSLSGIMKVLSFPLIDQALEVNAHQYGVAKILVNRGKYFIYI